MTTLPLIGAPSELEVKNQQNTLSSKFLHWRRSNFTATDLLYSRTLSNLWILAQATLAIDIFIGKLVLMASAQDTFPPRPNGLKCKRKVGHPTSLDLRSHPFLHPSKIVKALRHSWTVTWLIVKENQLMETSWTATPYSHSHRMIWAWENRLQMWSTAKSILNLNLFVQTKQELNIFTRWPKIDCYKTEVVSKTLASLKKSKWRDMSFQGCRRAAWE
jgi:hypothetical protein